MSKLQGKMPEKINYSVRTLDFSRSGRFDGLIPASRWLAFDMRNGNNIASQEEFLEAVETLLDGDAVMWLNSSKKFREMIDRRYDATLNDIEMFKEALVAEFPIHVIERTEGNVQQEIRIFKETPEESLLKYYGRAKNLLRKACGRNEPAQTASGLGVNSYHH